MRKCIKCGVEIHYHHLYCSKHYPQKVATIKKLSTENKKLRRVIISMLNDTVNTNKYITKKQVKALLKKFKLELHSKSANEEKE